MDVRFIPYLLPLLAMCFGFFVAISGCYLLLKQQVIKTENQTLVELPFFGRMRTNYPSLVAIFLGIGTIIYPLSNTPKEPPPAQPLHVAGKITRGDTVSNEGIIVGIMPDRYKTVTNSDGSYELDIPSGEHSYTGLAHFRDGQSEETYFAGVPVDGETVRFNYDFGSTSNAR